MAPDATKATPVTLVQQSLEAARLNDSVVAMTTCEDKGEHNDQSQSSEEGRENLL